MKKKNSLSLLIGNKSDLDDRRQVEESAAAQFAISEKRARKLVKLNCKSISGEK